MMKCVECGAVLNNLKKFAFHVEIIHDVSNFICPEVNCHRTFGRKDVFIKHFKMKHIYDNNLQLKTKKIKNVGPSIAKVSDDIPVSENTPISNFNNSDILDENINTGSLLVDTFSKSLNDAVKKIISELYEYMKFTKAQIQFIINSFITFLTNDLVDILEKSLKICPNTNLHIETITMFKLLKNSFQNVNSEYKRLKYFLSSETLKKPIEIELGTIECRSNKKNKVSLNLRKRSFCYIPLKNTLKDFLELPDVLNSILDHQKEILQSNSISNIINGSLNKPFFLNFGYNTIPLLFYFDDFESSNPLGSHAGVHKLGVVYFTIPSIPQKYSSRLENIFLNMIFYSIDRNNFGNTILFRPLVDELKYLETCGITIKVKNSDQQIHFKIVGFIGDNLGIHSIFGLTESFNSNYFCRFCYSHKKDTRLQCVENAGNIRNENDYVKHVSTLEFGIKEYCIFNELSDFHIYKNVTCDIMHDLFEGIYRYEMPKIISYFIREKYFTLSTLNSKIKYYTYDSKNIPPPIKEEHLRNGHIIMSASEMQCFVINFRLIVGQLIPEENNVWLLYLKLLEISEILLLTDHTNESVQNLKILIEEHHQMYLSIFQEDLKPKFHFLVHYPNIILKNGPPILISSMRFEARHKDFKSLVSIIKCKKNLPLSLSMRNQLNLTQRILSQKGFVNNMDYGPFQTISEIDPNETNLEGPVSSVLWYKSNAYLYNIKSCVLIEYDTETHFPTYGSIENIFVNTKDENVFFKINYLQTINFNLHYRAYECHFVEPPKTVTINYKNLKCLKPTTLRTLSNGKLYIF